MFKQFLSKSKKLNPFQSPLPTSLKLTSNKRFISTTNKDNNLMGNATRATTTSRQESEKARKVEKEFTKKMVEPKSLKEMKKDTSERRNAPKNAK
ncbi:hypothetical protein ABK040_004980 [Willaertia magna]